MIFVSGKTVLRERQFQGTGSIITWIRMAAPKVYKVGPSGYGIMPASAYPKKFGDDMDGLHDLCMNLAFMRTETGGDWTALLYMTTLQILKSKMSSFFHRRESGTIVYNSM